LSYDKYHKNAARLYRVVRSEAASTAFKLAPQLNQDFPEIQAVRFRCDRQPSLLRHGDKQFYEKRLFWADAEVLQIFSFELLAGDPKSALTAPFAAVITEEIAQKYFGEEEAVGKQLSLHWGEKYYDLQITGVLKNVPANSHFTFDILVSFATAEAVWPKFFFEDWSATYSQTYVLLPENLAAREFEKKFPEFVARHLGTEKAREYRNVLSHLQPITDIHLHSHLSGEIEANGDRSYLIIAAIIAALILGIACINYMNLATARAISRAKEIGVRQVSGAHRLQLIKQFLGEAILLALLAAMVALFLSEISLPYFSDFVQKPLAFDYRDDLILLFSLAALALIVGILAGSYPAFLLSGLRPLIALKSNNSRMGKKSFSRQALVVVQFAMSVLLIIATLVIFEQMDYVKNKRLGFGREQVLVIPHARKIRYNPEPLKTEFLQDPNVLQVAVSSHVPSNQLNITISAKPEGGNPNGSNEPWPITAVSVDADFLTTFGLQLLEGRNLAKEISSDSTQAFVLNEAAARALNWPSPIGKRFEAEFSTGSPSLPFEKRNGQVIGVVKDFHFESLHHEVRPIIFMIKPYWYFYISVKLRPENIGETLAGLERSWQRFFPESPFEYFFLDDTFDRLYRTEESWGRAIGFFALLSIFIACLGLLGLAAFTAEQRTKEIGIRKVLGASITGVAGLLSKDFVKLVLAANLIAWPLAYFAMNKWLQDFAYRIEIGWWVFALAGGLALLIALLTVSTQAIKAALANPVEALRYE
ncbi:MAG: ABC transporter permease, partial [bacterium]